MHLLNLVADRLWLVDQGGVSPWQGDLDDYRRMLLTGEDKPEPKTEPKPAPKRAPREKVLELRAEARRAEERVEKLTAMLGKLDTIMADPSTYDDALKAEQLGRKHAEASEAMLRAETLWMEALERLEKAERS